MSMRRIVSLVGIMLLVCMMLSSLALASGPVSPSTGDAPLTATATNLSHRLILELETAPLAVWSRSQPQAMTAYGGVNLKAPAVKAYLAKLDAEQAAVLSAVRSALPQAKLSTYINEQGLAVENRYRVALNGLAIDPGTTPDAMRKLARLPGVKQVYRDYAYSPALYTSTLLINAPVLWEDAMVGGRENAGAGVKIASMDGGIHKDAAMFDGTDFDYPPGYPDGGFGLTENNNGKIIVSRAYFRTWDPPAPGDENPWPGVNGTPHGTHTASTAAGNIVDAEYLGLTFPDMSGVAPGAWLMSYRVFYNSVTGDGSFYTAEGLAALEDIILDGADVVNNSWGGGPGSIGGEFDALDTALRNAWAAGVFVSLSTGNAGPGPGTADHTSEDYITVAATTTSGTLASGMLSVTAPAPVPPALTGVSYSGADFGPPLPEGVVLSYPLVAAADLTPNNVEGCEPWVGTPFAGKAVLISRGTCNFSVKVRNAQAAGAVLAIVYNNAGEELINMACGDVCDDITIPSLFVMQSHGDAMVAWCESQGDAATIEINTQAFQVGNTPDVVVAFSSRGPGVGYTLKPDIAAPGANILAQGYTPGAIGEARHLGYGQASGTSMASPHVAGAAALLRDLYPSWDNDAIKSALMSTSKYLEIYNYDGSPAQPLDMGAGRLDLTRAADPGVILDPPSLSFGAVMTGSMKTMSLQVTNIWGAVETYQLSTLYTGDGFDALTDLPGFTVSPIEIRLQPGASATVDVTFDSTLGMGIGDNQGYVVLQGTSHQAHLPVWARVLDAPTTKVLVIDNDASTTLELPDYASYYTSTLEALNIDYDYWDADEHFGTPTTIPEQAYLASYDAIIYFTGDNFYPDGTFTVTTPLSQHDIDMLVEYANGGGVIIAMGQDLAAVLNSTDEDSATFFYGAVLGGSFMQDSITLEMLPYGHVRPTSTTPKALEHLMLDLSDMGDGASNQYYVDEIKAQPILAPDNPEEMRPYLPLLMYDGPSNMADGIVAMGHRDQPTLERPGISYLGRSVYTTFGLEGVNDMPGVTTRAELLQSLLDWAEDEPVLRIYDVTPPNASELTMLKAVVTSRQGAEGVSYRWDFGDGTAYQGPYSSQMAGHTYAANGSYVVRVEAVDTFGNRVVGSALISVPHDTTYDIKLPLLFK